VSVKGTTRAQRWISTESFWKWIDAHGKDFGIGRPYADKDPPHVGPIDGKEYADKRGRPNAKLAELGNEKAPRVSCERRSQQGRNAEERYPRGREAYRLACLSADERIKLLSPDKLRDTLRLNLRGIT